MKQAKRLCGTSLVRRLLCLLLAVLAAFATVACHSGSDRPLSPGLSVIEGVPVYDEGVAMQTDHFTVTPGMMAYFFYSYGGALLPEIEKTVPYDSTKTLHEQIYRDGLSFYDVLMNSTLQKASEMLIYCEAALAAGVTLTEQQLLSIDDTITSLRIEAAGYSLELDAYLQRFYGPLMTAADLREIYCCELLASTYSAAVRSELEGGITEAQINAYVAEYGLQDTTPSRNIAYLAVAYTGGKANETAVTAVMNAMNGAPVAATLAAQTTYGSYGEEQNLTRDNMGVAALSDWLYAEGRAVGDYGRVEANGVTYILIYTGNGMSFAQVSARMSLYDIAYAAWYNGCVASLTFGYNYDILDSYDIS